jgi:hypothetical protein
MTIAEYLRAAHRSGLQRIAVTDHNTVAGALAAARREPDFVIPAEEVKTTQGELLGYFIGETVPRGLEPEAAIARLREQGAVISVSHPFDRLRSGAWKQADLERILPLVDAVEGFNARCLFAEDNRRTAVFAAAHRIPVTAGSDAHIAYELGWAGLELQAFDGPESFKNALATARPFGRLLPFWVHFFSTYAKWKRKYFERKVVY